MNLIHGDCLEELKNIPDKSIDLLICDLPYGCLGENRQKINNTGNLGRKCGTVFGVCLQWDYKVDLVELWAQINRLIKNDKTPILFFCNTRFGIDLLNSKPDWFRYDLVWNKSCGTNFLQANIRPMSSHEMIYVFSKKMPTYNRLAVDGKCPLSVININLKRDKLHPTAKPIELYKRLIEFYSNPGDTVLDPTAGSFNSGRACLELNRRYIGIEKDKTFFDRNTEDLITQPEHQTPHHTA